VYAYIYTHGYMHIHVCIYIYVCYARICYECLSRPRDTDVVYHAEDEFEELDKLVANVAESLGSAILKVHVEKNE
jgi:hypothetical protein